MSLRRKNILKQRGKKQISTKAVDKFGEYGIILSPISSEKVYALNESSKYVFKVHSEANANDVKFAFESCFKKKTIKINLMNMPEKNRANKTAKKSFKKAIVTLNLGEKLEVI